MNSIKFDLKMKMKTQLILNRLFLFLVSIFFFACNKEDASIPIPIPESGCLLTKTNSKAHEYENGRIKKYQENLTDYTTFEYNSTGQLIRENIFEVNELREYATFNYQPNYVLMNRFSIFNGNTNQIVVDAKLIFNSLNRLEKIEYSTFNYRRFEYDSNGNVTKYFVKGNSSSPEYLSVECLNYDNKNNFFSKSTAFLFNKIPNNEPWYFSKNNPATVNYYNPDGSLNTFGSRTYTYEYNNFDYVTKASTNISNFVVYEYTCQ